MQNTKLTGRKISFKEALRQARGSRNKGQFIENYGLAIGLSVVAIAVILVLYYVFGQSTGISGQVASMTTAVSAIQNQYQGDANGFAGITITDILPDVPSNEVIGTAWQVPIGGAITVAAANSFGTMGDSFTLSLPTVPGGSSCIQLVSAFSHALGVTVGGASVVNNLPGGAGYSAATAATACGTSAVSKKLAFTFGSASGT